MSNPTRKPGDPPPDEWDVDLDAWDAQFSDFVKEPASAEPNEGVTEDAIPSPAILSEPQHSPALPVAAGESSAALAKSNAPEGLALAGLSPPLSPEEIALELAGSDLAVDADEIAELRGLADALEPESADLATVAEFAEQPLEPLPSLKSEPIDLAEILEPSEPRPIEPSASPTFESEETSAAPPASLVGSPVASSGADLLAFDDDSWRDVSPRVPAEARSELEDRPLASPPVDDNPLAELAIDWDDGEDEPRAIEPTMPAFLSPHELVLPDDLAQFHDDPEIDSLEPADFPEVDQVELPLARRRPNEDTGEGDHRGEPVSAMSVAGDRPPLATSVVAASPSAAAAVLGPVAEPTAVETAPVLAAIAAAASRRLFTARVEAPDETPAPPRVSRQLGVLRLAVSDRTPTKEEYADAARASDGLLAVEVKARRPGTARAALSCARARIAERRGEVVAARNHYKVAIVDDAACLCALRGQRRLALGAGDLGLARETLARELATDIGGARAGLLAVDAELALAGGASARAEQSYRALLVETPGSLVGSTGRVDASYAARSQPGSNADPAARLGELAELIPNGELRNAVLLARAREVELRGPGARPDFAAAIGETPSSTGAALGLLRVATRERDAGAEAEALSRLAPLVDEAVGTAVTRRRAALRLRAGDPTGALVLLEETAGRDGRLDHACAGLRLVALRARYSGPGDASARGELERALMSTVAEAHVDDQGGLWCELGELAEEAGRGADALTCYRSAAALWPDDPRPRAAITRLLGPTGAELTASDPIRALSEEVDAGTRIEALLADDRATDAARLVGRESDRRRALGEPVAADLLGERAVRLLCGAGLLVEATAVMRHLSPATIASGARRAILRTWLRKGASLSVSEQAAGVEALIAEARNAPENPASASLWYRVGEAAEANAPSAAAAAYTRALELDGSFAPAEIALTRLGETASLLELRRRRRATPELLGPATSVTLALRPALAVADADDNVIASCRAALAEVPPGAAVLVEERLIDRLRRRGDGAGVLALLANRTGQGSDGDQIVLALRLAASCEALGDLHGAVVHLRRVTALGQGSLSARLALVSALGAAGLASAAGDLVDEIGLDERAQRVLQLDRQLAQAEASGGDLRLLPTLGTLLLELDPANHHALRAVERHVLRQGGPAERLALYQRVLAVLRDPGLNAVLAVESSRLRSQLGEIGKSDTDLRAALQADPSYRPALRLLLSRAERENDPNALVPICERLGEDAEISAFASSVMLARAGEAWARLGRIPEAVARYREAIARGQGQLPHLLALLEVAIAHHDFDATVDAAEGAAERLRDHDEQVRAYLVAGALAQRELRDAHRAIASFRAVRSLEPHHPQAFEHLAAQLRQDADAVGEVSLLTDYVRHEGDPARAIALHLRLAHLLRVDLGDSGLAKAELQLVLGLDPKNREALADLTELHIADEEWRDTVELLIRWARIEHDRSILKEIFRRLGSLYAGPLPDTRRAIGSHARVLEFDPDDEASLEAIAELYERDEDFENALRAIGRLTQRVSDPARRIELLLRAARLQEQGLANPRAAVDTLRRILVDDPLHLEAVARLNSLYEAQGDVASARVHLNRVIQVARTAIHNEPRRADLYHKLFQLFEWRHSTDQALMLAQLLDAMGIANAKERQVMTTQRAVRHPGAALASEGVDDRLFPPGLPAGFRHLFRLLDEPLGKLYRGDVKRLGLKRAERLPRSGHPVRDVANQIAAELRLPEIDIYVAEGSNQLLLEPSDPITLVIGQSLLPSNSPTAARGREGELRFLLTRQLKMVQSHLVIPMRLSPEELGLLVAGLVRQFVPDFAPPQLGEAQVSAEAARLARAIPRKTLNEVMPFAMECAAPGLDLAGLSTLVSRGADRAGLVGAGAVKPALAVLGRLGDPVALEDLARFVISEELFELRQALGLAVAAMG